MVLKLQCGLDLESKVQSKAWPLRLIRCWPLWGLLKASETEITCEETASSCLNGDALSSNQAWAGIYIIPQGIQTAQLYHTDTLGSLIHPLLRPPSNSQAAVRTCSEGQWKHLTFSWQIQLTHRERGKARFPSYKPPLKVYNWQPCAYVPVQMD